MTMAKYWDYQAAARANHAEGRYVASWLNLFEAEEAKDEQEKRWRNKKPSTLRQKEIQRLWQQRGLLERTKANITSCRYLPKNTDNKIILENAILVIMNLISQNNHAMQTIRERIPA